jgi:hypothetical protein
LLAIILNSLLTAMASGSSHELLHEIDRDKLAESCAAYERTNSAFHIANRLLFHYQLEDAIEKYTQILDHESQGHPIVFLNRSLAYLYSDYPTLAAADACTEKAFYWMFRQTTDGVYRSCIDRDRYSP